MRILGVDGSPRENGNTEKLVKAVLDGARENGGETRHYKLAQMNISPCNGCMTCRETGVCVFEDDMKQLYDEIQAYDALVLGSPVYMWQVNAQTKAFIDRLALFIKPDFSTRLKGKKKLFLAFTQGNPDSQAFNFYFDYLGKMFSFMHWDFRGYVVAAGTRGPDDILQQTEILEKAKEAGRRLAG